MSYKTKVAILVDGEFFIKKHCQFFKKEISNITPEYMAKAIQTHCLKHIRDDECLYRVFFYDCKPLSKKVHYPLSNKALDLGKSHIADFRNKLHAAIVHLPCFAIRYGYLDEKNAKWRINDNKYDELIKKKITLDDLSDEDFSYTARQKGMDMKIGIDITTLAYKKLVEKIVLISGDSDFVPAAKLARKEGLHFVLDPMGNAIKEDLAEHIDRLTTTLPYYNTKIPKNLRKNLKEYNKD
jgi:hypothetical protein